jgi:hypothetical protein
MNENARQYLTRHVRQEGTPNAVTVQEIAKYLDCSTGYVCNLPVWKKLMEQRKGHKSGRTRRVQSLPQSTSIGEGFRKTRYQQQKDAVVTEVSEREELERNERDRQQELRRLIAEQKKDFEPSPRDEGNYEVRVRRQV